MEKEDNTSIIVDFLKSKGFSLFESPYVIKRTYCGRNMKDDGAFAWVLEDKNGFVKCGSEQTVKNIIYAIKKGVCEISFAFNDIELISPFCQCNVCGKIFKTIKERVIHNNLHVLKKKKELGFFWMSDREKEECEEDIKELKDKLKNLKEKEI